ncbi:MAG TPA: EamA family transporter, partial [Pedobacter sp.]
MEKNILKGALLVGLGAASYGALATVVKLSYQHGFTTAEVTTSQFSVGFIVMFLLNVLFKKQKKGQAAVSGNAKLKLIAGGTAMGLTSICYYFAVKYIPVSVAIVLLMQSVWMGIFLEAVLERKWPSGKKIAAMIIVLAGTGLATNIFSGIGALNWKGLAWGFAAGLSYTISLYSSNSIAADLPPLKRSLWLLA